MRLWEKPRLEIKLSLNPEAEKIVVQSVTNVAKKYLPDWHFKIFLFGSRVWGTDTMRSDFDIGIEAEEKIPSAAFVAMQWDLEEARVLQKIDLVDFAAVGEEFKDHAKKKIKIIYEQ